VRCEYPFRRRARRQFMIDASTMGEHDRSLCAVAGGLGLYVLPCRHL
jgi:hypothetical protein